MDLVQNLLQDIIYDIHHTKILDIKVNLMFKYDPAEFAIIESLINDERLFKIYAFEILVLLSIIKFDFDPQYSYIFEKYLASMQELDKFAEDLPTSIKLFSQKKISPDNYTKLVEIYLKHHLIFDLVDTTDVSFKHTFFKTFHIQIQDLEHEDRTYINSNFINFLAQIQQHLSKDLSMESFGLRVGNKYFKSSILTKELMSKVCAEARKG
jgi:hypothetical protein